MNLVCRSAVWDGRYYVHVGPGRRISTYKNGGSSATRLRDKGSNTSSRLTLSTHRLLPFQQTPLDPGIYHCLSPLVQKSP